MNYTTKKNSNNTLQFIPDWHRSYDPLQYPLIFCRGQDGWHNEIMQSDNGNRKKRITCLQHVNYQLMDRNDESGRRIVNPILFGRSLGQQYIVDQFAKVELNRLNYIKTHQKELRAELYSGAKDAMKGDSNNLQNIGKHVILPSSVTGSDRYMHQQYLDSIALWQRFGHADGFLTYTFNPNCREITENLRPGETALDRPNLVARIFKLKKQ